MSKVASQRIVKVTVTDNFYLKTLICSTPVLCFTYSVKGVTRSISYCSVLSSSIRELATL